MDKFDELLEKLNAAKIEQTETEWSENIPENIWDEYFKDNHKDIAEGLDVDKHRWYETSVSVIEIFGRLLGTRLISDTFSESTSVEDCSWEMCFFEMEAVPSVTYKEKVAVP